MYARETRPRGRFRPAFPAAANDNKPQHPRPRAFARTVRAAIDQPAAFALYLLLLGAVVAAGYSVFAVLAFRFLK